MYPFKFNASWLLEEEVITIVKEVWKDPALLVERDVQQRFVNKLKSLKIHIKAWAKEYKRKQEENLVRLEGQLKDLFLDTTQEISNSEREFQIKFLEAERDKIL
jgi:hypothetical protein